MKIALAQINPIVGDFRYNTDLILNAISKAKESNADLIIFPELSLCGYPPRDLLLKHKFIETQNQFLKEIINTTDHNFAVLLGLVSNNQGLGRHFFNSLAFIHNKDVKEIAHKTLLPNYDVFDETRYFEPAFETTVIKYQGINFGLSICEDIWIEELGSLYTNDPVGELISRGADIIINAAASPFHVAKSKYRLDLIQNLISRFRKPVIYVNQVGANDHLIFDGNSMAIDQDGKLIAKSKAFVTDISYVEINAKSKNIEPVDITTNSTDLNNNNLDELCSAIILGIKDYIHKCGFSQVVLGLSGGIDSAIVSYLCCQAIGKENVKTIMLPSKFTSQASLDDARQLATNLQTQYLEISIDSLHQGMETLLPDINQIARENIQARLRANILLAHANTDNSLLLCTSNKSELAVGYSTIYGDSCGAFSPIGDILKTTVFKLCKRINIVHSNEFPGGIIPENIINKPPSAELRENQKDQDSLPDYETLDQIIELYVNELQSYGDIIAQGFDTQLTKHILNLIDRNEYKRQQSPFSLKVASKAFGTGRRMPIAQKYKHLD